MPIGIQPWRVWKMADKKRKAAHHTIKSLEEERQRALEQENWDPAEEGRLEMEAYTKHRQRLRGGRPDVPPSPDSKDR
jgi:hypothetical protein